MHRRQIQIVQESFERLLPNGEAIVGVFYQELLSLDPALDRFFQPGMIGQGKNYSLQ